MRIRLLAQVRRGQHLHLNAVQPKAKRDLIASSMPIHWNNRLRVHMAYVVRGTRRELKAVEHKEQLGTPTRCPAASRRRRRCAYPRLCRLCTGVNDSRHTSPIDRILEKRAVSVNSCANSAGACLPVCASTQNVMRSCFLSIPAISVSFAFDSSRSRWLIPSKVTRHSGKQPRLCIVSRNASCSSVRTPVPCAASF